MKSQADRYRSIYVSLATVLLSIPFSVLAYDPPIGIPEPSFGIDETHRMYEGEFFTAGGFNYRDAGNGPYTHYIDNTAANCNDNNAGGYGTAAEPRCTIFGSRNTLDLPAGSVLEIHGGPYNFDPGSRTIILRGTQNTPVFVRGIHLLSDTANQVMLQRVSSSGSTTIANLGLEGQYYIIENLHFYNGIYPRILNNLDSLPGKPHHISLRNLEVEGNQEVRTGVALHSGAGDDVVIYNGHGNNTTIGRERKSNPFLNN